MPTTPTGRPAIASEPGGAAAGAAENGDFLRIVRDLRRVHSHIAALAYPVLERATVPDDRDAESPTIAAGTWFPTDVAATGSPSPIPPDPPAPAGPHDRRGK
jgi:hypothetical protein